MEGRSPLIQAAYYGHTNLVKTLLKKNANINAQDYDGCSALMLAGLEDFFVLTKPIEEGSDLCISDCYVNMLKIIDEAVVKVKSVGKRKEIVKLLLEAGANADLQEDGDGLTALIFDATFGFDETTNLLVAYQATINKPTYFGDTPLKAATNQLEGVVLSKGELSDFEEGLKRVINTLKENGASLSPECQFTRDCEKVEKCNGVMDASCICNYGSCIIKGNPFMIYNECNSYIDCDCKSKPENCFCNDGQCQSDPAKKYECHESTDCSRFRKCLDNSCTCSRNLCEFECNVDTDCNTDGFGSCPSLTGYSCKCRQNICHNERLPDECNSIQDCVTIGKCEEDKPCACNNGQCTKPWYTMSAWYSHFPHKSCQTPDDCDYSIAKCQNDRCSCENIERVDTYERFGECEPKQ